MRRLSHSPLKDRFEVGSPHKNAVVDIYNASEQALGQRHLLGHARDEMMKFHAIRKTLGVLDGHAKRQRNQEARPIESYAAAMLAYRPRDAPNSQARKFMWVCVTAVPVAELARSMELPLPQELVDGDAVYEAVYDIPDRSEVAVGHAEFTLGAMVHFHETGEMLAPTVS